MLRDKNGSAYVQKGDEEQLLASLIPAKDHVLDVPEFKPNTDDVCTLEIPIDVDTSMIGDPDTDVSGSVPKFNGPVFPTDSATVYYSDERDLPWEMGGIAQHLRKGRLLGRGGIGAVYEAEICGRKFALKEFDICTTSPMTDEQREMFAASVFENEARQHIRGAQFTSAPKVYEVGRDVQGTFYIVMELLDGHDLTDLVAAEYRPQRASADAQPLSTEEKILVGMGVANDLDEMHRRMMVHRDVKTQNVQLTDSDAHLIDFGIAKLVGERLPFEKPGCVYGTPNYMAPEVYTGGEENALSDQFSLGMVLYEMFSGINPLRDSVEKELSTAEAEDDGRIDDHLSRYRRMPDVQVVADNVPDDVAEIIERCTDMDPRKRYASCKDVLDALRKAYIAQTEKPAKQEIPAMYASPYALIHRI